MISGLEEAVAAGVIDRRTAERLEPYLSDRAGTAETADPDDEKLRLVTGFNDIFVTIGLVMFLGSLGYIMVATAVWSIAGLGVAAAAWGLAEFFTRRKRLALPSIVLLVAFVGSVFLGVLGLANNHVDLTPTHTMLAGIAAALAAFAHWKRFRVPITIAAGTGALVAILLSFLEMQAPHSLDEHPAVVFLPLGLAVFAFAMWFDSSDLQRQTRRTDIAFWLHLLAAPLIVHPLLMPIVKGAPSVTAAMLVILVFLALAFVALVVDRRAILVSSLFYLGYAAWTLMSVAGSNTGSVALSLLAVGATVLTLSAAWRPLRRAFMSMLPASVRARLPAIA